MLKSALTFESVLIHKLTCMVLKKGCKIKANKIVKAIFRFLKKKTGFTFSRLVFTLFLRLNLFVEMRSIKVRRRVHLVPFALRLNRRYFLIIKLIIKAITQNKKQISTSTKILEELLSLYVNGVNSSLYKLKEKALKSALDNRSNLHFRW